MKLKRAKNNKKTMNIYKNAFKFRLPFQIILDGNFFKETVKMNSSLESVLDKLLGGKVKIFTTSCVYKELKSLKLFHLLQNYKSFERKFCSHSKTETDVSGAECIKSIIGTENKLKFGVATQDKKLRRELAQVPGVPLIYINRSVYILEPPSAKTLEYVEKKEDEKVYSSSAKVAQEQKAKSGKKLKRKEPNPLSVKKKKVASSVSESVKEKVAKRKRRSRQETKETSQQEHLS